ncbi:MAG: nucleoside hydrolase, partial [Pseudomonadota bacterium]
PLEPMHAVDFIVETVLSREPGTVTLATLGPLTNIALALIRAPEIAPRIREIVAMGGGFFEGGNTTPAAEFNIYVDPHAAKTVFEAGIPLTLIPLDLTHQALTTGIRVAAFRALGTRVGDAVADLIGFFERHDEAKYGHDGAPLHDPCVIAWMIAPDLFRGRFVNVEVETGSELTMGMTVIDWWRVTGRAPNATVLRHLDADGFFTLLTERLARL